MQELIGNLVIDRDYPRNHYLSEQDAINKVLDTIKKSGKPVTVKPGGKNSGTLIYREWDTSHALAPWWLINIAITPEHASKTVFVVFAIDPSGTVLTESEFNPPIP